jgi:hypothetical protein
MNASTKFEIFVVDRKGQSSSLPVSHDEYLETLREFIDFVNCQVGVYMDALTGFAGNKTRIEFQVARLAPHAATERQRRPECYGLVEL